MIKKLDKIYLFYVISVIIFLFLTTKYLDLEELINSAGQMDIISYTEISKFYPSLPNNSEIIVKHIAQRFFIPYFAGLISFHLNLDLFTVYKILDATVGIRLTKEAEQRGSDLTLHKIESYPEDASSRF